MEPEPRCQYSNLGKPFFSKMDEFLENFQRGGVISDLKNFVTIFLH